MSGHATVEGYRNKHAVRIANGAAVSSAVNIAGGTLVAIQLPAAWTAADLTFEGSFDGTTFAPVFDDANAEVKVAAATVAAQVGRILVSAGILSKLAALPMFRIVSGVAGTQVNQGAQRDFVVITKA
jgi:hypothetical protein